MQSRMVCYNIQVRALAKQLPLIIPTMPTLSHLRYLQTLRSSGDLREQLSAVVKERRVLEEGGSRCVKEHVRRICRLCVCVCVCVCVWCVCVWEEVNYDTIYLTETLKHVTKSTLPIDTPTFPSLLRSFFLDMSILMNRR